MSLHNLSASALFLNAPTFSLKNVLFISKTAASISNGRCDILYFFPNFIFDKNVLYNADKSVLYSFTEGTKATSFSMPDSIIDIDKYYLLLNNHLKLYDILYYNLDIVLLFLIYNY